MILQVLSAGGRIRFVRAVSNTVYLMLAPYLNAVMKSSIALGKLLFRAVFRCRVHPQIVISGSRTKIPANSRPGLSQGAPRTAATRFLVRVSKSVAILAYPLL